MLCSDKRVVQIFSQLTFLVLVTMMASSLSAQSPPNITSFSVPNSVKEMGIVLASVSASDPDGDSITYTWSFESDPTGQAHFFDTFTASYSKTLSGPNKTLVILGVGDPGEGPPGPTGIEGQQVTVRVEISDGSNTTAATSLITVSGFNQKPIVTLDTSGMGTRAEPKVSPSALSLTAGQSYDPEGEPIRFAWKLAGYSGGSVCPGGILVLFGKETDKPSLPIPKVSATPNIPMSFTFVYRLFDGMYQLAGTATGWAASPNGCNSSGGDDGGGEDNPVPQVSVNTSTTQASAGDVVIMSGLIDDPGDTHTQSWMQLDNTTPVALSSTTDLITGFVAPNANALLRFRFSATDSAGQSASADIAILVWANSDGGSGDGGSGDGGSGDGGSGPTVEAVMVEAVMVEAVMVEAVTVEAATRGPEVDPLREPTRGALVSIYPLLQLSPQPTPSRKACLVRFTPATLTIPITLRGTRSMGRQLPRGSRFPGPLPMDRGA